MAYSLLAHLYPYIKGSQEDIATYSLQYLLSNSDELNRAFTKLLSTKMEVELEENLQYSCQVTGKSEEKERPDMAGFSSQSTESVLCEMKFYATLTSNQPGTYLDRLRKNNGKGLMFVCPSARRTSLWAKLRSLCNDEIILDINPYCIDVSGIRMSIMTCLALRWEDLDFENRIITVNHSLTYRPTLETGSSEMRISLPKTEAGIRTIPMLDVVKDAFEILREEQEDTGYNEQIIDGMYGFVFKNRFGEVPRPHTINQAIKRIVGSYNSAEILQAKKERREPLVLPSFSCHILRHTFATRLCEAESNLKVIQSVMGHRNVETTMDIYAEATDRKKQESFENLAEKLDNIF